MGIPHVGLRAMALSAGEDLWLYGGLYIKLQQIPCDACVPDAEDGDAINRST